MITAARSPYAGYRFPAEIISHAVWLYFRFPLSLRMVDELLAAGGILVSHETVRQWALKFGQAFANQIRRRLPRAGDKWLLDEVVVKIAGVTNWLWRAVDQTGDGARRPGAEPARQGGRHAPAPKAAQAAVPGTARDDHR
jgi:putative transposase